MRKLVFYPKLALANLWRNRITYAPYLLASTVSVFTLYTLLAINNNGALNGLPQEGIVRSFTAIGTIIMAIFCSVLIFYTNSFLIKRRKKELGLYSILGMEKKNIGTLMFFETLFIALAAIIGGILLGALLSQLLFWALLRMVRFEVMLKMPPSLGAMGITALFFGVIFMLAFFANLRQVRLANPIELLSGEKHGEKEPKASWLLTVFGLATLGAGYWVAIYFKSPMEALMFFLVAVLLVIIGTYCLFTSGSIAVLKLMRKNKKYYYKPNHFISVSGMIYRMKQNAAGLATICILSCMVLVTVAGTVSLNVGGEDALNSQYPFEFEVRLGDYADGDTLLVGGHAIAENTGVEITNLHDWQKYDILTDEVSDGVFEETDNLAGIVHMTIFSALSLEAYNTGEGKTETLEEDEALLFMMGGDYNRDTLTIGGRTYRVRKIDTLAKQKYGRADVGRSMTLILPTQQDVYEAVGGREGRRVLYFDTEGTPEAKEEFRKLYRQYSKEVETAAAVRFDAREDGREDWYASNGGFLFLGVYFGVLFMLAAALIIYYKQLSEGYDDAERFEILQKVGMSEGEVKKTINKQIMSVFFLPLIVAVIHISVAFLPISRVMVVFGVVNKALLMAVFAVTVLVYTIVYFLVFRRTARTYYRIVKR